jgi:erythromycin esterase-like protein
VCARTRRAAARSTTQPNQQKTTKQRAEMTRLLIEQRNVKAVVCEADFPDMDR